MALFELFLWLGNMVPVAALFELFLCSYRQVPGLWDLYVPLAQVRISGSRVDLFNRLFPVHLCEKL